MCIRDRSNTPLPMVRLIALIISIILQIIAASVALGFMKLTKYRLSWILLSLSFVFMTVRSIIQLFEFFRGTPSYTWRMIDEWTGVLVSVMIIGGVILIREIFYSLKRAETDRLRSEKRVINAAISTIKDISNNLSPHVLSNFGLASAISAFTTKINQTRAVEIDFKSNMEGERLDNDKEVVVYRAVCELINNSVLHSGASRIEIELNKHEKFVTLQFYDNGRGFDTSSLSKEDTKGMGLSNIETRVRTVEGVFILESTPGKGTSALIKLIE